MPPSIASLVTPLRVPYLSVPQPVVLRVLDSLLQDALGGEVERAAPGQGHTRQCAGTVGFFPLCPGTLHLRSAGDLQARAVHTRSAPLFIVLDPVADPLPRSVLVVLQVAAVPLRSCDRATRKNSSAA